VTRQASRGAGIFGIVSRERRPAAPWSRRHDPIPRGQASALHTGPQRFHPRTVRCSSRPCGWNAGRIRDVEGAGISLPSARGRANSMPEINLLIRKRKVYSI
jgi:hypothetical protein